MPRWRAFEPYFWSLVKKSSTGCWLWRGGTFGNGYGRVHFRGRRRPAHRVAWQLAHGRITPKLLCCHRCDNKLCVRPTHLFLGSQKDNMQDWTQKGFNRLVNDRTLWRTGDHHWTCQPAARLWRQKQSHKLRAQLRSGLRIVLRGANGRLLGTRMI